MKKKLVIWSDFVVPSGFGNVAKNLFDDLSNTFDVSIVAINYFGNKRYDTSKYFVYSTPRDDIFNKQNLFDVIKLEQPELIILFQDSFNISDVIKEVKSLSPKSKIISYFPIDAADFSIAWYNVLDLSDVVITYTDWAISVIKDKFPKFTKTIHKLYHGVDFNSFYPLSYENIDHIRSANGWTKKFVVCNINRFQPRKAVPLSIRAFSMFAKGYKKCKCGNWYPIHLNYCDANGCSKEDVVETIQSDIKDVYYYLHMNAYEHSMGLSRTCSLQNHLIVSGFRDEDYGKIVGINAQDLYGKTGVSESFLNEIYNASNINMSTTGGEGFGLSLIESMAAGTRSIAPNNSAIPEVLKNTGRIINNIGVFAHQVDNAFMRPIVDVRDIVKALQDEYRIWKNTGHEKTVDLKCYSTAKTHYDWKNIRQELNTIINDLLSK